MKKPLLLLLAVSLTGTLSAQNWIPRFIRKMYFETDSSKRSSFVILPVLTSAPETGIEAGGAGLLSFYTDTIHRETRVSNVFAYATITTKGQNRLSLSSSYWLPQNKFHYTAAISYINFPSDFYGIGNNTRDADKERVDEKRFKVSFNGEKLIGQSLYIGYVAGGFNYTESDNNPSGIFNNNPAVQSRSGGAS